MSTKHGPKAKGTEHTGSKGKGQRVAKANPAPEAVVGEATGETAEVETPFDDPVPTADAPADVPVPEVPAPKRKRDLTIDDLRAEYARVTGHESQSRNRRYLVWRLSEAGQRRSQPKPRRVATPKAAMQVLPLGLARATVAKLDAAWKALGYKNRMAFLRDALVEKLAFAASLPEADPALSGAAAALKAESAT